MNPLRLLLLLVLPVLVAQGALAGEDEEPRHDAALATAVRKARAVREAERIVVAEVLRVGKSPGIWCGYLVTRQEVTYRILEALYGGPVEGEVRVGHLLVSGSLLVSKDAPFLEPGIFHPGARFLLCLNRDGETWTVRDETFGAVAIDPPVRPDPVQVSLLRQVLQHPELGRYVHPEIEGRVPLKVALTEAAPVGSDLVAFGQRVQFLPAYLLLDEPHIAITEIYVGDRRATVHFTYDVEGLAGQASFVREDERYRLETWKLSER